MVEVLTAETASQRHPFFSVLEKLKEGNGAMSNPNFKIHYRNKEIDLKPKKN